MNHEEKERLIRDILVMCLIIENSYDKLTPDRQREVESKVGRNLKYRGFDGNHEVEYARAATQLIFKTPRFALHFEGRADRDSHTPMVPKYRQMLAVYQAIRASNGDRELLTAEELLHILT